MERHDEKPRHSFSKGDEVSVKGYSYIHKGTVMSVDGSTGDLEVTPFTSKLVSYLVAWSQCSPLKK